MELIRLTYICIISLLHLAFVGCVVIPNVENSLFTTGYVIPNVPEDPRFTTELKASIRIGVTTKDELRNILGEPDAARQNNSIYIYADSQKIGWILPVTLDGHKPDAIDWNRNHLLIIQLTRGGIVKEVDHIVGKGSQTREGIYVADPGLRPKGHSLFGSPQPIHYPFEDRLLVLYAQREKDERAKEFRIPPNKSAIYFFRQHYAFWLLQSRATITGDVFLDDAALGDFGDEGYFYWVVDPGVHDIRVSARPPWMYIDPGHLSIDFQEGRAYFIEQTWENKGFLGRGTCTRLAEVDKGSGELEVGKRRLIIGRFSPFDKELLANPSAPDK